MKQQCPECINTPGKYQGFLTLEDCLNCGGSGFLGNNKKFPTSKFFKIHEEEILYEDLYTGDFFCFVNENSKWITAFKAGQLYFCYDDEKTHIAPENLKIHKLTLRIDLPIEVIITEEENLMKTYAPRL